MARSFIDPSLVALATQPAAPPWDWNPGATFVRAFNDAQALQLKREEIENERQIMEILLPYKVKKAQLDLEELRSDVKVNEAAIDLRREEIKYRNQATENLMRGGRKPKAIFNPASGMLEPVDDYSDPLSGDFGGKDTLPPVVSASDTGEPMIYNEDGTLNAEPLPSDEETETIPMEGGALRVPTNPLIDDEGYSQNSNPLLRDEFFGNIASVDGPTLKPSSMEGFNNPLAEVDEDATSVPVGAQYTGGANDVASGKFDASLADEEPRSVAAEAGFDLGRFADSVPDETAQAEPEDERLIREIQSERQKFEQNIYEMRRQGYDVSPQDLQMGYERTERRARALLLPFANKLGEAGMASMKTLIDGKEPFESAYAIAKRSVAAADPERLGPVAPDNPQLKAALDNKKTYRSTLPEDPTTWTDEEREAVAAFDRTIQVLTAVPKRSLLQDVVATKAELEGMTQALNQRRPFAKTNPNGTYDVIPMEQLESFAGETKQRLDALVPRLRETEDPDLFNPLRYKTEDEMTKAKAETLERNPNAFVITPKGELSYLRNFNAREEEAQQTELEQSELDNMTPEERERMMTEKIKRAAGTVGPMIKRAGGALLRGARAIR
jgi:hypothetical protein